MEDKQTTLIATTAAASAAQAAATAASAAATAAQKAEQAAVSSALIQNDITYIKRDIGNIFETLKEQGNTFVKQPEHNEVLSSIKDHEDRIRTIEQNMWKQIGYSSVISAIASAGLVALAEHFIK